MTKTMTMVMLTGATGALLACSPGAVSPVAPTVMPTVTTATTVVAEDTTSDAQRMAATGALPPLYTAFRGAVTVTPSGGMVTLQSRNVPDHRSPYWGQGHTLYEAPHSGMQVNPHRIADQTLRLRVPVSPQVTAMNDTPLGPIGMAVNGVALFNQYAAGRQPLTFEIVSFDRYNGHPAPSNQYHYHMEPLAITGGNRAGLVGVLLDGFPVYGPEDAGGQHPTGLDSCNGHTGPTPHAPDGAYHYHTTTTTPYIAGCFRGTPGAVG